jgi:hypothetical protein
MDEAAHGDRIEQPSNPVLGGSTPSPAGRYPFHDGTEGSVEGAARKPQ